MQDMQQGGNARIGSFRPRIAFAWTPAAGRGVEVDASAYLLTGSGKVRGDHDMVFYNQPDGGAGAVRFRAGGGGIFDVDLDAVPEGIERIVFCLTIDEAQAKGHTLALIDGAEISVMYDDATALRFRPILAEATEAAMIFGELYRRGGQWKFRAVGQGFNGGLAPLAESFGIDIATEDTAPVSAPAEAMPLARIALDEPDQTITLVPEANGFGEILVTLTWSHGRPGYFGESAAIDLDLGCLVEMQDGRKTAVQALGGMTGTLDAPPFVALSGDDRTGDAGETLRIDGRNWPAIKRIAIFANIYDGQPDWRRTAGQVLLTMSGQPGIEIAIAAGNNACRICGILLMENDGGHLKVTRRADYVADQQKLDEQLGWGMRWQPGTKS